MYPKIRRTYTDTKTVMNVSMLPIASAGTKSCPMTGHRGANSALAAGLLRLGLVEEAALQHAGALLGRDGDVAGREQEDLVGDALHPAVERVGQAAREIDQPLGQLGVGALEVEDHRHTVLEAVGDLLRVVERARDDQVYLHRR